MPRETIPIYPGDWSSLNEYLALIGAAGSSSASTYNVKDTTYGAVGNGVANDTAAITAAMAAASAAGGGTVVFPKGTYMVTGLTVPANVTLDLLGLSTIKKTAATNATLVTVGAANVTIKSGTLDGNRAAGALGVGVQWDTGGTNGLMQDVTVTSNKSTGVSASNNQAGTPAALTCRRVISRDNFNGAATANGFGVDGGAVLQCYDCDANQNERAGYLVWEDAGLGCVIDGRSYKNNIYGLYIRGNGGSVPSFISSHDKQFGLAMEAFSATQGANASNWQINYVATYYAGVLDTGTWPDGGNTSVATGTGVELMGACFNNIGIVIGLGCNGYALGFARSSANPSVGANFNAVGNLLADSNGSTDSDPGLHFSGDSCHNYVGNAYIKGYTVAMIIGEDTQPIPAPTANPLSINSNNYVGSLYAIKCPYAALIINAGYRNRVDTIVSRNSRNVDTAIAQGLVSFFPNKGTSAPWTTVDNSWVYDNTVGYIDHRTDSHPILSTGTPGGGVTVITTSEPHEFESGDSITIAAATNANLNATWTVTRTGNRTFTVPNTLGSSGGAAGTASYIKPTHIVNSSTNSNKNMVLGMKHRGDFQTAATADAGTVNILNNDSGRIVSAVTAWTPGLIAAAGFASTTVTVTGAAIGDAADAAYDQSLAAGLVVHADVSAANTVRVTITNSTGAGVTPTAGNVVASVYKKLN